MNVINKYILAFIIQFLMTEITNFMRNIRSLSVLFFCTAFVIAACGKREVLPPIDLDTEAAAQYAYFPLKIGQSHIYQVDSVTYDFANGGISRRATTTFAKEVITDTLRDNTGALRYVIERYERADAALPWVLVAAETAQNTDNQIIRTENNLRFLKLIFPMDRRSEWDGNRWIDPDREIAIADERMRPFANWRYEVDSIDIKSKIGKFSFDSTLVITEVDETNVVEQRFSRAWYAKGIGLVRREQRILDSQYCNKTPAPADCATKPWTEKAERGYILTQTLME